MYGGADVRLDIAIYRTDIVPISHRYRTGFTLPHLKHSTDGHALGLRHVEVARGNYATGTTPQSQKRALQGARPRRSIGPRNGGLSICRGLF